MRRAKCAIFGFKIGQRRDVTESTEANVVTFQKLVLNNVATLDINVATLQRVLKINVATLISHVATFQRV